jgi:hypothetical protein
MIDPSFCLQLLDHLISGGETHESSSLSVEGTFLCAMFSAAGPRPTNMVLRWFIPIRKRKLSERRFAI